jgi:molybdopterin molybdotransferase
MLTIDEARATVLAATHALDAEDVALPDAHGRILAAEVVAGGDVPPFANSAMDGFAVRAGGNTGPLRIVGESRAGAPFGGSVGVGQAVRISTGAALPAGGNSVVPLERCKEGREGQVSFSRGAEAGENVRPAGDDVRAGTVVLRAGTPMSPVALAMAASAGRGTVSVARRPRVAIVATGDELVTAGEPLGPGQIHDSNAIALAALAQRSGAEVVASLRSGDGRDGTVATLASALDVADVVLVSGGVSVGPHDHVKPALEQLEVQERFWRVALRPGKPTWFGTRGEQLVFGLPGNPVSALVTFVLFARPALSALQGAPPPARWQAELAEPVARRADRDEAVRVRLDPDGRAHVTGPQGSHQLASMIGADGLAIIVRGEGQLDAGSLVEIEGLT